MPCRIPSSAPPLLIFLVFLLSILISTNASPVNSPPTGFCSNSTCGEHHIAFPFWQAPDQFNPPFKFWGHPLLMLICQNDTPIISIGSQNYSVSKIDYQSQTVSLADTDVLAAGTCPKPQHNLSLTDTALPSYTFFHDFVNNIPYKTYLNYTSSDTNLTFFLDCQANTTEPQITCLSGKDGYASYVFTEWNLSRNQEYDLERNCQDIVVVPVLYQEVNRKNMSGLSSDFGTVLKKGFQLGWSNETWDECDRCQHSGGLCGFEISNISLNFICSNHRGMLSID